MQLNLKSETYGNGDQSWLGSKHGTDAARTVTIDISKLGEFPQFVPSGIPLKEGAGGLYEPVTAAEDALAGFLLTDQSTNGGGNIVAAMLDHGRVRAGRLPAAAFDITTLTTPNPAFVIVKEA